MTSSNPVDASANNRCKYDVQCGKTITNQCQGCGHIYCMDHYLEHQKEVREYFETVTRTQDILSQKWKSFISELSADAILDSIKQIYEFSLKSDEIEETVKIIQRQLQELTDEDKKDVQKQSVIITNEGESGQDDYVENDIRRLKQDIEELQIKLEELTGGNQKRSSEEHSEIVNRSISSDSRSESLKSSTSNGGSQKKRYLPRLLVSSLINSISHNEDGTPTLSHLLVRQTSPSILDLKRNELRPAEAEDETHPEEQKEEEDDDDAEEDDEMIVFVDPDTASKISHKVRFSNNIVRYLRGPVKAMVHGTMRAVDVIAQGTHISDDALQAVKKGLARQNQIAAEQQATSDSILSTFVEITSDWQFEGENSDRGFSSPSIWMRNPQGRRILVKIQEHPLCAANEWLAYVLGRLLGLPVNEVHISIYENNLVTLHADVAGEDEKTITFMGLPRQKRKVLMTDPIMESMDIFDRIIQNVDRNQQNILITIPKTTDINDDDSSALKIHLIDHSSCFGMGKLNAISLVASKFHSNHLAVVKFDPIRKSKQFERYLIKLPAADRPLISKTLNRYAAITDDQFDTWINKIQDLLSTSQYNRIHGVLRRQRDIAKRYTTQWGISPKSSSIKSHETTDSISSINETIAF